MCEDLQNCSICRSRRAGEGSPEERSRSCAVKDIGPRRLGELSSTGELPELHIKGHF